MNDELLRYYNNELAYIRTLGDDFGRAYPKIARRLRLSEHGSQDPHVERLIEAFAFLTARVRKKLDDDFPEIAEGMLESLHPHFLAPTPSLSILQFNLDNSAGKLTTSYQVPRHSMVESESVGGESCRFRTCYPVVLWPLELESATLCGQPFRAPRTATANLAKAVIRLRLRCLNPEIPIGELGLDKLRFFLQGQRSTVHQLYEMIFNNVLEIAVASDPDDPAARAFESSCLGSVGFERGEELLPFSPRTPRGYALLTEYFALPEKFLFVDVNGLDQALAGRSGSSFEIFLYLNRHSEDLEQFVSAKTFRMGCTPVVNLFKQTAEPIRMTYEKYEYPINLNARRAAAMEVYSVDRVTTADGEGKLKEIPPLYSPSGGASPRDARYWCTSRRQGLRREGEPDSGTDVYLSLVDLEYDPIAATDEVFTVEATCSNRDLPARLPFGGGRPEFRLEQGGPLERIDCLVAPTATRRPPLRRGMLWRLMSHLSLNYLSITGQEDGAAALREMLQLYNFTGEDAAEMFDLDGISRVQSRRVVGRITPDPDVTSLRGAGLAEPGFCRGLEIEIELDAEHFVGTGEYLFGAVMERFLALYCSINSFSKMILSTKQRKEICRWPPRTGERILH